MTICWFWISLTSKAEFDEALKHVTDLNHMLKHFADWDSQLNRSCIPCQP